MISTDLIEGRAAIEALAEEWRTLVDESFTAAFCGPDWHLAWLDAFEPKSFAVVTARAAGRLVGVMPLSRTRTDARGLYMTRLTPWARGDYQPPIIAPQFTDAALRAMLRAGFDHFGRHGVLWWPNVPETDPGLSILRSFLSENGMPYVEERETAVRLRLDGRDYAAVEQQWTSSHRKDVRRQRKRLAENGPVSIWQPENVAEAEPVLQEFFRVHDEKWLAQGFPGMFQDPLQRRHFQAVLRRMFRTGLHFSTLRCGDTHISYHFGFFSGGWIQWYRPSFRLEYAPYSPSKIHVAMLIEEACRRGWKGFDFLLGAESYKDVWANETLDVISIHSGFHRYAPSYWWFSSGKPYFRQRFQLTYLRARAWIQQRRGKW